MDQDDDTEKEELLLVQASPPLNEVQWLNHCVGEMKNRIPRRSQTAYWNVKKTDVNDEESRVEYKWSCCDIFSYYDQEKYLSMNPGCMRMHHQSPFRKVWDGVTCILLVYLAFALPVLVGIGGGTPGLLAMMQIIDYWFMVDVFLNFLTTYEDDQLYLITSFRSIALNYVTGWFFIDFISSIPLEQMGFASTDNAEVFKAAKLLKLLKLMRVFRFGRLIQRMQQRFQIKHGSIMILKFCAAILVLAHWLGCIFYLFTTLFESDESWNHVYLADQLQGALYLRDTSSKYIACLYWAITTMSTIGYGDISPRTDTERVFVTCAMMLGAGTFAYGLTNVCSAVFNYNQFQVKFEGCQDELADFLKAHHIPMVTRQRIQQYLWYKYNSSSVEVFPESRDELLSLLSVPLRDETLYHICDRLFPLEGIFQGVMFNGFDSAFKMDFARTLDGELFSPMDFIVMGEDMRDGQESSLSFLHKGEAIVTKGYSGQIKEAQGHTINDGYCWGERSVLLGTPFKWTVRATTFCDVYSLSNEQTKALLAKWPIELAALKQTWVEYNEQVGEEFGKEFERDFVHGEIANALRARCSDRADMLRQALMGGGFPKLPDNKSINNIFNKNITINNNNNNNDINNNNNNNDTNLSDTSRGKLKNENKVVDDNDVELALLKPQGEQDGEAAIQESGVFLSTPSMKSKSKTGLSPSPRATPVVSHPKALLGESQNQKELKDDSDPDAAANLLRDALDAAHTSLIDELLLNLPEEWNQIDDANAMRQIGKIMGIQRKYYQKLMDQIKTTLASGEENSQRVISAHIDLKVKLPSTKTRK